MTKSTVRNKEVEQGVVFKMLIDNLILQKEAAAVLNLTPRWVREKFKRYCQTGDAGLVHKARGKPSKRKLSQDDLHKALTLLKSAAWQGFGPTFASEKLVAAGIKISSEKTRQIMTSAGLWEPNKTRPIHRKKRERRACRGMLVQGDGSTHAWFEDRGLSATLIVFIDDATSEILWLEFAPSESHSAVSRAAINYFKKHGKPLAFYVDHGSVFDVNSGADRTTKTTFELALEVLNIELIHANSPQAKGRVERANKTLQDRLVKELRLNGISTIEAANAYLQEGFIDEHNKRFAVAAQKPEDLHRKLSNDVDLDVIFAQKTKRRINNDYTIKFEKRTFQINEQQIAIPRPGAKILVCRMLDGGIKLRLGSHWLASEELLIRKNHEEPLAPILQQQPEAKAQIASFKQIRAILPPSVPKIAVFCHSEGELITLRKGELFTLR